MKGFLLVFGVCLLLISAAATPVSIVYGIYLWGSESHPLAYSSWEACKLWIQMLAFFVPGIISTEFASK